MDIVLIYYSDVKKKTLGFKDKVRQGCFAIEQYLLAVKKLGIPMVISLSLSGI